MLEFLKEWWLSLVRAVALWLRLVEEIRARLEQIGAAIEVLDHDLEVRLAHALARTRAAHGVN